MLLIHLCDLEAHLLRDFRVYYPLDLLCLQLVGNGRLWL